MKKKYVTLSDEDFDKLHSDIYPNDLEEENLSHEVAVDYFENKTGLRWYIHSEDINKGIVVLEILDEQKWFLIKIKLDI
jgi:hypothetical protein